MGVRFSDFPAAASIGSADEVVGLQGGTNKRFSFAAVQMWIRQQMAGLYVPSARTVNGKALSSDIALTAGDVGAAAAPKVGSVALSAVWSGSGPYTQTVTVTGAAVTGSSKVDLQPTAAQIAQLIAEGVQALTVENQSGTLTVYAVGAAPASALTVQCTVEETT